MSLKVWTYPNNPRANKGIIAAKYNGVNVDVAAVEMGVTNKTPEFLALNPLGKVPVLETPEGGIWESNAIARYCARLGDAKLFGKNAYEAAQVEQWLDWVRGEVEVPGAVWLYPIFGIIENNPEATKLAIGDIKKAMDTLDTHLKTRSFLVGERLSLADIVVSQTLVSFYTTVFDAGFRKKFANVNRWFQTCVNQPNFLAVAGKVELIAKAKVAPAPAKKADAPAKEAPKEAAKEAAPAKKAKNPLDSLPKSSFDLGEWKRKYSNADDTRSICPWLWENLDFEGYSVWRSDYKYPEDNKVLFMACNLVTGFFQRMETRKLHNYAFGSLCMFGEADCIEFTGAWIFRGTELPQILKEVPDFDSHSFTRVDHTDAKQKKFFEDLLCWDGDFEGKDKKFSQGKNFK